MPIRFATTPFLNTRQFYHPLESGLVDSELAVSIELLHSPLKDQQLLCGDVDATTMSMGKYILAHHLADTDVLPTTPIAIAGGLTYREGNGVFVPADSPITDPTDLIGKQVGIHDRTLAMTYHKTVLAEQYGIDPQEITWIVDSHAELSDRLADGDIVAAEQLNDRYWTLKDDSRYRRVYDMPQAWNAAFGYPPLVHLLTVDRDWLRDSPDEVESFLASVRRSRDYTVRNRETVITSLLQARDDEWSGDRTMEAVEPLVSSVECPLKLGAVQRRNVTDWGRFAQRFAVFKTPPFTADELFPADTIGK